MTHILITSGGTTVPIDPVRSITNQSSGRFGTELAKAALEAGMQVTYLASTHAKTPFAENIDFYAAPDWEQQSARLQRLRDFTQKYRDQYHELRYQTYHQYAQQLEAAVTTHKPEIIMLAAAVSDYLVDNYSEDKVRSSDSLHIQLKPAAKLIHSIRKWSPQSFIVGFKLLVNATPEELVAAANHSIKHNDIDLCVANDLSSLQRDAHEIFVVARDGDYHTYKSELGAAVISECLQRMKI